jgi:hypothetical protein
VKTAEALSLLIAREGRVARIYFGFFRAFRGDGVAAQCWWDLARDEPCDRFRRWTHATGAWPRRPTVFRTPNCAAAVRPF